MRDGIDHRAYRARLRSAGKDERRLYAREFGRWMKMASASTGRLVYWSMGLSAAGVALAILLVLDAAARALLVPIAIPVFIVAQWIGWRANQRARQWRRSHPFEEWRNAQSNGI